RFTLVPSIRTVKAAAVCSGFEPSGSTNVWKRTVSLSMNVGQQVKRNFPKKPPGAVPEGRRVTSVRRPVARSSTTIWAASSPPGPGPRSVKAIRRPFGLKAICTRAPNRVIPAFRDAGDREVDDVKSCIADPEGGYDPTSHTIAQLGRDGPGPKTRAVDPDGAALRPFWPVMQERDGVGRGETHPVHGALRRRWRRRASEPRDLMALARTQVDGEDLLRLQAVGVRAPVGVGKPPAVLAEGEGDRQGWQRLLFGIWAPGIVSRAGGWRRPHGTARNTPTAVLGASPVRFGTS